uniref:Uncharacterized protein n=1 Tax=viral metagenome TaxID=1070528 RepID=A0A6C0D4X9_9ZZZZ
MNRIQTFVTLFFITAFIAGIYVTLNGGFSEGFEQGHGPEASSSCPNLLIQKGNVLLLYNTNAPIVDGVNPIPFFNLDEYINYVDVQRKQGKTCPVLFLQQENNAQGQDVLRMRPSPFDLQGGLQAMNPLDQMSHPVPVLDASRENKPYNENNYAGFDPQGQYVGIYTNLDQIHNSTKQNSISDNPMDPNWAGIGYTQQMIDSGKYADNNITRPVVGKSANTAFYPGLPAPTKGPIDIL